MVDRFALFAMTLLIDFGTELSLLGDAVPCTEKFLLRGCCVHSTFYAALLL
jgi:hypothetical protein